MDGSLEVEHLLKAARLQTPGLSEELDRLSADLNWAMDAFQPDGSHVVPFARWAKVAGAYADEGFSGLRCFSIDESYAPFVIALLEEVNSSQAIEALFSLFADEFDAPNPRHVVASRIVQAINSLFSVKSSPASSRQQRAVAAKFLNAALLRAKTNGELAWAQYALRGTGDASSLELLAAVADAEAPYTGARMAAIRAIRKRVRDET